MLPVLDLNRATVVVRVTHIGLCCLSIVPRREQVRAINIWSVPAGVTSALFTHSQEKPCRTSVLPTSTTSVLLPTRRKTSWLPRRRPVRRSRKRWHPRRELTCRIPANSRCSLPPGCRRWRRSLLTAAAFAPPAPTLDTRLVPSAGRGASVKPRDFSVRRLSKGRCPQSTSSIVESQVRPRLTARTGLGRTVFNHAVDVPDIWRPARRSVSTPS